MLLSKLFGSQHQCAHHFSFAPKSHCDNPIGPQGCCTCRGAVLQLRDVKFGEHGIMEQMRSKPVLCPRGKMLFSLKAVCCKALTKGQSRGVRDLYCQEHVEAFEPVTKCHTLSGLNYRIYLLRVLEA